MTDDSRWIKVYSSVDSMQVSIIKGLLDEHGFDPVVMNRQDSAYVVLGEIDLLVPDHQASEALVIIKNLELEMTEDDV